MQEEWRPVAGAFRGWGYEVSSHGRVRNSSTLKTLTGGLNPKGYRSVGLSKDGVVELERVHSLVAAAFIGPRPDGMEVNHKDGNKENNAPSNLEYLTHRENLIHALRTGLRTMPEQFGELARSRRKLDADGVVRVRQLLSLGMSERSVASLVGLGKTSVARIKRGRTYTEV